jgi:hypothetical protein
VQTNRALTPLTLETDREAKRRGDGEPRGEISDRHKLKV